MISRFPASKAIAIPKNPQALSFSSVSMPIIVGALCGLSACVIPLNERTLQRWKQLLGGFPSTILLLDIASNGRSTLNDGIKALREQPVDITLFHSFYEEYQAGCLAINYLRPLIKAIPAGLIILA